MKQHNEELKAPLVFKEQCSSIHQGFWGGSIRDWLTLLIAFQMMLVAGTLYSFSAFSSAIKAQLNLTDSQATLIVTIGNFGLCFAPPSGKFCDHFGPNITAVIGGILAVIGFIPMWIVCDSNIDILGLNKSIHPYWLYIFYFIVGQGSIFTYVSAICCYQNFPQLHQGKIIGILDCGFGLSAFVFALVYNTIFKKGEESENQNLSGFLLFLTIVMAISNLLGFLLIKLNRNKYPNTQNATITEQLDIQKDKHIITNDNIYSIDSDNERNINNESFSQPKRDANRAIKVAPNNDNGSIWLVLKDSNFILLFCSFLIIQSGGLLFMNNVSYICDSLHRGDWTSYLTVIIPLTSAISRFCIGFISDLTQNHYSRCFYFVIATIVMFLSQLLTVLWMDRLFISGVLVGSSFGCSWCLCPLIVSEQFGRTNFGFNWGIIIMASAFGGLVYEPLQTKVYDHYTKSGNSNDCYGEHCYKLTFLVSAIACVFAVIVNMYLCKQFKKKYQRL